MLGLASVGLSTKGTAAGGGGRRTIGFMGVGFKAVYKVGRTYSFSIKMNDEMMTFETDVVRSFVWVFVRVCATGWG